MASIPGPRKAIRPPDQCVSGPADPLHPPLSTLGRHGLGSVESFAAGPGSLHYKYRRRNFRFRHERAFSIPSLSLAFSTEPHGAATHPTTAVAMLQQQRGHRKEDMCVCVFAYGGKRARALAFRFGAIFPPINPSIFFLALPVGRGRNYRLWVAPLCLIGAPALFRLLGGKPAE